MPALARRVTKKAMPRKPASCAPAISSRWNAATSRVAPFTVISQGTAHKPCKAMKPPTMNVVCGAKRQKARLVKIGGQPGQLLAQAFLRRAGRFIRAS